MKILHVVPTYLPATRYGGPIYSVHGLCKALAARGHEVHVFTTSVDGPVDSDVSHGEPVMMDGVRVWYFRSRRLRRLYWSPPMMRALKRQMGTFDLVHLHSVFLWPTWAAARTARAAGIPYVLSPRGMLVPDLIRRKSRWLKTAWIGLIERRNLKRSAAIHLTSEGERSDLHRLGLSGVREEVIPNGIDLDELASPVRPPPEFEAALSNGPCALYFGRLSWKKGLDRLIRAWREVARGHLIIAGNDDEGLAPRLNALTEEAGLESRVTLLPRRITREEVQALLARVRVTVLPSYSENFGNVVVEAMAAGRAVVVTPEVGAAEVVRASSGGVIAQEGELAEALDRLMTDAALAQEMGRRGRAYVRSRLAWDRIAERMLGLYRDVIRQR